MTRLFLVLALIFIASAAHAAGPLAVHFIDVGQGDSIFIQSPDGKTMLIDGGENDGKAEKYLASIGVQTIDVLIGTHPHLDHIGGLPKIVKRFGVRQVVMPRVTEATTVTYTQLLEAIKAKGLRITEGKAGLVLDLGPSVQVECLAPGGTGYKDVNDYSVVLKMTCGDVSFLLTGDATTVSEKEMLQFQKDKLKTTVLEACAIVRTSSSSAAFITAVAPQVAIFSVGKGNDYGHPTKTVWNRISNSYLFRTDEQGTVILTTDGRQLAAYSPPVNGQYQALAAYQTPAPVVAMAQPAVAAQSQPAVTAQYPQTASEETVYVTKSGAKYHRAGCRSLSGTPTAMSKADASQKYGPCGICKP